MSVHATDRRLPAGAVVVGTVLGGLLYAGRPVLRGYVGGVAELARGVGGVDPGAPGVAASLVVAGAVGLSMNFLPCNLPVVMSLLPATAREESRTAFVGRVGLYGLGAVGVLGTLGFGLGLLGATAEPLVRGYGSVGAYVAGAVIGGVGLLSVALGGREFGLVDVPDVGVDLPFAGALRRRVDEEDGPLEYVLLGAVYGGSSGGCPLPTYHLLLVWVVVAADPVYGAALLTTYVLGRVLPVAALGAALRERPRRAADLFSGRYGTVRTINGTVLLAFGSVLVVFTGLRVLAEVVG